MLRPRVSFLIDEPERIVTVRYVGALNGDQIVPEMLAAYRGLERAWEYDCIHDLRRHEGRVEIRDNEALGRGWQEVCGGRDAGRRTAIVSNDPLIDARLPLTQRMFPFRVVALFGTVEAARVWIAESRAEAAPVAV